MAVLFYLIYCIYNTCILVIRNTGGEDLLKLPLQSLWQYSGQTPPTMVRLTEIHVIHPHLFLMSKLKTGRAMRKLVSFILSNAKILFRLIPAKKKKIGLFYSVLLSPAVFILLESYSASEDYYLLSDVLPEDKELRNRLKLQRLVRNHSLFFTHCHIIVDWG